MIKRNEKKERSSSEYFVYIFGMLHVLQRQRGKLLKIDRGKKCIQKFFFSQTLHNFYWFNDSDYNFNLSTGPLLIWHGARMSQRRKILFFYDTV